MELAFILFKNDCLFELVLERDASALCFKVKINP